MNALCTNCSGKKHHDRGDVPAIRRYRSQRIRDVYTAALSLKARFYILSGKFGLVGPCDPIPDYDHLLQEHEVTDHAKTVAAQLGEFGVDNLLYVTASVVGEPALAPYVETIKRACAAASVTLFVLEYPSS